MRASLRENAQPCHDGGVNWSGLARVVTTTRVAKGFDTQKAFAEASRISLRTVSDLEAGKRDSYSTSTLARLEAALGWPPGRVDEILHAADDALRPVAPEGSREALHPIALRVHRLLTDHDLVPEEEQRMLETMLDRLITPPERKYYRIASISFHSGEKSNNEG